MPLLSTHDRPDRPHPAHPEAELATWTAATRAAPTCRSSRLGDDRGRRRWPLRTPDWARGGGSRGRVWGYLALPSCRTRAVCAPPARRRRTLGPDLPLARRATRTRSTRRRVYPVGPVDPSKPASSQPACKPGFCRCDGGFDVGTHVVEIDVVGRVQPHGLLRFTGTGEGCVGPLRGAVVVGAAVHHEPRCGGDELGPPPNRR